MVMRYLAIISCGICAILLVAGIANAEWEKGVACYKAKDYPCAVTQFKEVVELNQNHYAGYYMLGLTYVEMRKIPDAEKNFQKALEFNAKDFGSNYQLALIMMQKKQSNKVVQLIDQGLSGASKSHEKGLAIRLRGAAYLQLKQFDKASQDLEEALKLLPNDDATQYWYGLCALQQKKFDIAYDYLNKSYTKKQGNGDLALLLVKATIGAGNYPRAKEIGETLMQKGKSGNELLAEMGIVYMALKEYPQAILIYKQLPDSDPNKYLNLAQAYTTIEDWLNAETTIKALQKKDPQNAKAYELMGFVYLKRTPPDPSAAMQQFDKAYSLSKNPKYVEMKKKAQQTYEQMLKQELKESEQKELKEQGKVKDTGTQQTAPTKK